MAASAELQVLRLRCASLRMTGYGFGRNVERPERVPGPLAVLVRGG